MHRRNDRKMQEAVGAVEQLRRKNAEMYRQIRKRFTQRKPSDAAGELRQKLVGEHGQRREMRRECEEIASVTEDMMDMALDDSVWTCREGTNVEEVLGQVRNLPGRLEHSTELFEWAGRWNKLACTWYGSFRGGLNI